MKIYIITDESEASLHLAEHVVRQVYDMPHIRITIGHLYTELGEDVVRQMNRLRGVLKENSFTSDIDSIQYDDLAEAVEHICSSVREGGYTEVFVDSNNRRLVEALEAGDCGVPLRVVDTYPAVSSIMTRDVVTIPPDKTAEDAAYVMGMEDVSSVVVTEDKRPIGILTKGDLVDRIIKEGRDPRATRVEEVMSRPVITVGPSTSVIDASKIMKREGIARLVITEGGVVRGILTVTDFAESSDEVMNLVARNLASINRFFKRLHYDYLPP
ncbi:MAG: CBS domain-containing protein [Euryarchaeota archaeon]|nr:CBS domain-containing protein [Euryarchaeota archaeon]